MKERQLGLLAEGFTKPMLDAMNAESKRRYGLGVGVLVQELERSDALVQSLAREGWVRRVVSGRWRMLRRARVERALWDRRLRACAAVVAESGLAPARPSR